jgi:hypothetical protein
MLEEELAYTMIFLVKIGWWEQSNILHLIHLLQSCDPMIFGIDVSTEFMMAAFIQSLLFFFFQRMLGFI